MPTPIFGLFNWECTTAIIYQIRRYVQVEETEIDALLPEGVPLSPPTSTMLTNTPVQIHPCCLYGKRPYGNFKIP